MFRSVVPIQRENGGSDCYSVVIKCIYDGFMEGDPMMSSL